MNPELMLVSKILETGDFKSFVDSYMQVEDITDLDSRRYLMWIKDYYSNPDHPRAVPTPEIFQEQFPDAVIPPANRTTVKELVKLCKNSRALKIIQSIADDMILKSQDDPTRAFEEAASVCIKELGKMSKSNTGTFSDMTEQVLEEYEKAKEGIFTGVPWPWQVLNTHTAGMENGSLIVFYARPKQMKTWVSLYIVTEYYRMFPTARVLIYSLELSLMAMAKRISAILTRIPCNDYLMGSLSPKDEGRFIEMMREVKFQEEVSRTNGTRKGMFVVAPTESETSPLDLRNKIETYSPDIVLVDAFQHLEGDRSNNRYDWKAIARISRSMKAMAVDYNIPLIAVTHANRKEDSNNDMLDVAFTDSVSRDADVMIKLTKQDTQNLGTVVALDFKAVREYNFPGMLIDGKPARSFDIIKKFDNSEQLYEFISKNKRSVATYGAAKEDPGRVLGQSNFTNSLRFGDKGA